MKPTILCSVAILLLGLPVDAQQSTGPAGSNPSATDHLTTVRGCLESDHGNYIVIEEDSSMVFALKGVGDKPFAMLHKQVEVKGRMLPNTIKTGVRPEKGGSNPSDTVRGIDGMPLQIENFQTDVRVIAKRCKRAD